MYVAPPCDGTLAFADPAGQIDAGALIVATGDALIGTVALVLLLQPFAVTVTPRTTLPEEPAVKVIAFVPCPPEIEPFVIVQA